MEYATQDGTHFDDPFIGRKGFDGWLEAFEYLKAKLPGRKTKRPHALALVIDEYPAFQPERIYARDAEGGT